MTKTRTLLYLSLICIFLTISGTLLAGSSPAEAAQGKLPEANVTIGSSAKKKLKIVKMVKPAYPAEAKSKGIEGQVKIDVLINKEGDVAQAEATSGPELLRNAALEAVRQWKYEPPGVDAKATVDVNFKLGPKPQEAEPKTKS